MLFRSITLSSMTAISEEKEGKDEGLNEYLTMYQALY